MTIGLGLPLNDPAGLLDWARQADHRPFSSLGLADRLVYDNPEPMVALAAIAGATSRIRLQTEVLLAPLRETALLAKQAATLDRMSNGRFTLGLGVGGRSDDHEASGTDLRTRGRRLDAQMSTLRSIWTGDSYSPTAGPIGPSPHRTGGPEVLFGGFSPAAIARVGRCGDGFLGAGLNPNSMNERFRAVEAAWSAEGRTGKPRLIAQCNVALGAEGVVSDAKRALSNYYAFTGRAEYMVDSVFSSRAAIRDAISAYRDIGADEVMLYCWSGDVGQVNRLADLVS
ncbi:LLM class flavin-dependent oxidoreductase [Rhodococcus sp. P1Y]|uniref:LLM class flavin-dependent oxidoreductase n=1 Tax=Rhodococcus sp. P1Y TaxID=1302308 RepID=UPI000EB418A2|nr:LLM class flavin-dependent oxidoreductase [Rhodococcus sp. P1Y]AYJ47705.1 LLM class flavin-dependent oxidoreductase [Rhodococcus sp. P1Y]